MDNYLAIVVDNDDAAYEALHALWDLDAHGDVTVHGTAVIHRDKHGFVDVASKRLDSGLRTAIGVGLGALLGALAGPIGAAAGATIAVGTAAGVGAAAGGVAGLSGDVIKSRERGEALLEARFVLPRGKSAVIAEVSEVTSASVDALAHRFGGSVYRRSKGAIQEAAADFDYADYLWPYDHEPK